jgi:hypothetical protein
MKNLTFIASLIIGCGTLSAAPPLVKTVPWVPGSPLIPHDTWSGKTITVKGACIPSSAAVHHYTWDFGDGTTATGDVNLGSPWNIGATHAYTGATGSVVTARLTVTDSLSGNSATTPYYIAIRDKSLPVEVNIAIDEGLWYLHTTQSRDPLDAWWGGYKSVTAINVNAFEANGHLEGGDASDPYTETVHRGLRWCLEQLAVRTIGVQTGGDPEEGQASPNGLGIYVNQGPEGYQNGIFIDALVASGTPAMLASVGAANVVGRSYLAIVQDICDSYAWGQYDGSSGATPLGGWRYNPNDAPDSSACQWAAIGLIAAERKFGCKVPSWVKTRNVGWLNYSQRSADGAYGYGDSNPLSGVRFGTTPSGMVECAMDGIGRGNPLWDKSETLMRDNWGAGGNYATDPLQNYYGLLAFVKAMQLHDSNGDGIAEPLTLLKSATPGVPDLDWYGAEVSAGAPKDGVARTVVNDQSADGSWAPKGWFDNNGLQTARSILMLNPDVLGSGNPVAVAMANPNPSVAGQTIHLDGSGSFHGDPSRSIVSYQWDLDHNGSFETSGPFPTVSFASVGNYPVTLRVTDNSSPAKTDDDILVIRVSTPPLAPTADAGGPYVLCPEIPKWFLDGTRSVNPDDGQSEAGKPGDAIVSYEWDLDGDGRFNDAVGAQPEVKAFMTGLGVGTHLIQLRVTDRTATSFPSSGQPDLSSVNSAVVQVKAPGECDCITNLAARAKSGEIQLTWTGHAGTDHYNVYRGVVSGGPYLLIGSTVSTYSAYLDTTVANGTPYYYVVRGANLLNAEVCQSNEVSGTASGRTRR